VKGLSQPYLATAQTAADHGKPFIMFETNTASCGGFSGLSDSFVSAMWMVDYALDMASNGFSNALLHVGGQSDYYNVSGDLKYESAISVYACLPQPTLAVYPLFHEPVHLPPMDSRQHLLLHPPRRRSTRHLRPSPRRRPQRQRRPRPRRQPRQHPADARLRDLRERRPAAASVDQLHVKC
jgi:hypothetical protein